MSVHVKTGHQIDVLYSVGSNGRKYLQGILPRGGTLLPLHEQQAQALVDVLQTVLNEIAIQTTKETTNDTTEG